MKKQKNSINLFFSFFLIFHLSCLLTPNKNRPNNKFMPNDLVISSCQHLLTENTEFSKYCDKTFSSFSLIESIAISDSGQLFLLTNNNEMKKKLAVKARKDVIEKYTWDTRIRTIRRIINDSGIKFNG